MGAVKRAAEERAKAAAKKIKVEAKNVETKCGLVVGALKGPGSIPKAVSSMLAEAAPGVLSEYKDKRHAFQTNMLGMVGSALSTIEEEFKSDLAAKQALVDAAEAEKASRLAAQTAAGTTLEEKTKAVEEAKAALKAAEADEKEHAKLLKAAENSVTSFASDQKKAQSALAASQAKMTAFIDGPKAAFGELKELAPPPPEPEEPEAPAAEAPAAVAEAAP
eukprot:gnl/TRDRNA2_/TRDRNA2_132348_c0_seq2.p1 gnl/TRDRNA2_/TRDRNA2_132348_c0~~gnl/TRDRNA2_/TRDRNA2_132348_c0_seq2.p1  ORF type:complete len:248 (-),score=90.06 gnl/TRDRNA2_/TRDRNA2_132348_c0_seq2:191-850(-)